MIKEAFLKGFLDKRKAKKRDQAREGFHASMDNINAATAHHPMPSKVHKQWADELEKSPDVHGHVAGWNFYSDRFNPWLSSPEGKKWNDTQAKKSRNASLD